MSKTNILSQIPDMDYHEPAYQGNNKDFNDIIASRRSVRVFESEKIPQNVIDQCIDNALLAPNSSNLQCWHFIQVTTPEMREKLVKYCFSQPAAKTADQLIVAVARPDWWYPHAIKMINHFSKLEAQGQSVPQAAKEYYQKICPIVYAQGPFGILGLIKRVLFSIVGFFKVVPRGPFSVGELKKWAVKSSALACQNFILSMSAHGYDTCAMEGFDEKRVKKLLSLKRRDEITMIIACGKRKKSGVYGPRVRFERERFVSKA